MKTSRGPLNASAPPATISIRTTSPSIMRITSTGTSHPESPRRRRREARTTARRRRRRTAVLRPNAERRSSRRLRRVPRSCAIAIKIVKNQSGAKITSAPTAGSRTAAVRSLVLSTQPGVGAVRDRAEAALAKLVGGDRAQEFALAEIGPQCVGEIEFGVGELKEKKIGDSQFSRGSNQQVGIGKPGGSQFARQQLLVDLIG